MSFTFRQSTDDDRERLGYLRAQAFIVAPPTPLQGSIEGFRTLERDGRIVAGIRVQPVGQWFGGKCLPIGAVSSVMVSPEDRGGGTGSTLIAEALREMRDSGIPVSTLYPSTLPTYRKAGYELAGYRMRNALPVSRVPMASPGGIIEPFDDSNTAEIIECYSRFAARTNGQLDRPEWWWRTRIFPSPDTDRLYKYLVRADDGRVGAYIMHTQPATPGTDLPYNFTIACRDFVWLDADGARGLLAYVSSNRALATELVWFGGPGDALQAFVPEQDVASGRAFNWMTRLVDVAAALEARGYPEAVDTSVEIAVSDALLDNNNAAFSIKASGGTASVARVAGADARIDVGALAAIFTGFLHPYEAARTGRLVGATPRDLSALSAMFAGPAPSMTETY